MLRAFVTKGLGHDAVVVVRGSVTMRTLFISNALPYPLNVGGNLRLYHILVGLSRVSDVTLVCPLASDQGAAPLVPLRPYTKEVITYPLESIQWTRELARPRGALWMKSLARALRPGSSRLVLCHSEAGSRVVRSLTQQAFDLVWAQRLISMSVLPEMVPARVVVDLDDLEHRKLRYKIANTCPYPTMVLDVPEYFKMRRLERGLRLRPYEFTVCSDVDRNALGAADNVRVLPNGVDVPPVLQPDHAGRPPVFAFVGTMDYPPNVDAVRFFAQKILPIILKVERDARFVIVGRSPSRSVQELHDGRRITVTGTVPEVGPQLSAAAAVVAPIRFGGGTRIKILEAFAYGRAVIATRVGAEGIDCEAGRHLMLADDPEEFAAACLTVIRDGARRRALVAEAFKLARDKYQWKQVEAQVGMIARGTPDSERTPSFGAERVKRNAYGEGRDALRM